MLLCYPLFHFNTDLFIGRGKPFFSGGGEIKGGRGTVAVPDDISKEKLSLVVIYGKEEERAECPRLIVCRGGGSI